MDPRNTWNNPGSAYWAPDGYVEEPVFGQRRWHHRQVVAAQWDLSYQAAKRRQRVAAGASAAIAVLLLLVTGLGGVHSPIADMVVGALVFNVGARLRAMARVIAAYRGAGR
ncbi:MAG: hypothetical protein JWQ81_6513 [Amycolatopsis sp.]|uniref:hypothetical protein n=1 Tax=Amycolatopsis sp. TaxID=37632 RepID=UPI002615842E|nr:hypothetical protein [Amycolatopsis sp.]MCU1685774.1 hypothetical protein [Amycolatopsis sp.]